MKVGEAIDKYLDYQRDELGQQESVVLTMRQQLLGVLESVLGDPLPTLTANRVRSVRSELARPDPAPSPENLAGGPALARAAVFLNFCAEQGWAAADLGTALHPPAGQLGRPRHMGEIVRRLREAAGLSRQQLASGVHIPRECLQKFEVGRYAPSPYMLRRLLSAPAMDGLVAWAEREGLPIDLTNDVPSKEPS